LGIFKFQFTFKPAKQIHNPVLHTKKIGQTY